jgi:hypothetical protein
MIIPSVKVRPVKIVIKTPEDERFWKATGLELVKDIRKRTQTGKDADERSFKPYKKSTAVQRAKRGRTLKVNLTDTGKMLGSMAKGVRAKKSGVRLQITGRDGFKAYNIKFNQRRNFFAFNDKQVKRVIKKIKAWMKRKNK